MKATRLAGLGLALALGLTTQAQAAPTCEGQFNPKQSLLGRLIGKVAPGTNPVSSVRRSIVDSFGQDRARIANAETRALQIERAEGPVRFNEVIDEHIRDNPKYAAQLLRLALRRLPDLKDQPFNLVISGGVVEPWLPILTKEIQALGLDVDVIAFPGALSFARNDRIDAPDLPESLRNVIATRPTIFMDDTYTNGGTAQAIRQRVEEAGGKLSGVFVVYEGGKGDPASLYKSGRMNQRPVSMGQFPDSPRGWKNSSGVRSIGLARDGAYFVQGTTRLTRQAERLADELKSIGIALVIGSTSVDYVLHSVRIGSHRGWDLFPEDQLDPNYFLNRLVEEGVLAPVTPSQPRAMTSGRVNVTDLRNARKPSRPVEQILATQDPKTRVAELSNVDWSKTNETERELLLNLAKTTTNSFEMGALIKIASNSSDSRWSPILAGWAVDWMPYKTGWQTYLYKDVMAAIMKIEAAQPKEPELTSRDLISMQGTKDNGELKEGMLPRGSALLTSSGDLAQQGIKAIIHAASGAMTKSGGHYDPTLESVENSVRNSVRLAEAHGFKRIAIPLIGGRIFLDRIGVEGKVLAARIITAALEAQTKIELRFVAFADGDVMTFKQGLDIVRTAHIPDLDGVAKIQQGSLTDFNIHGADVIVNAANMEVQFGGGLSGMIAQATKNSSAIDKEAADAIRALRR